MVAYDVWTRKPDPPCTGTVRTVLGDSRLGYIGATVIADACIYVAERSADVFAFKVESVLGGDNDVDSLQRGTIVRWPLLSKERHWEGFAFATSLEATRRHAPAAGKMRSREVGGRNVKREP